MNKTKIEWVKNPDGTQGYTWNPITGCLNGCPYCYARKLANTRLKHLYAGHGVCASSNSLDDFNPFYPRFWEDRLMELNHRKQRLMDGEPKQIGIFPCDMSDLFGIGIPEEWTRRVMDMIWDNDEYDRFYLLTKQPQNLIKFSPFPENCWVGVTATGHWMFYTAMKHLSQIEATVKFISAEPLLSRVALASEMLRSSGVSQVIIGAQTKPYKPPKISWVEEIVGACDKAGIPVFLKENLEPLLYQLPQSCVAWTGWGEQTRRKLRQEVPEL